MSATPLAEWIQGTWDLRSFTLESDDQPALPVMGDRATGFVTYGADGWMAFQISAADRVPYDIQDLDGGTPEQTVAAARTFLAYAGPYEVNEAEGWVAQTVAMCLIPNWIGDVHQRHVDREADGGMMLTSDPLPMPPGLPPHRLVLRFRRHV